MTDNCLKPPFETLPDIENLYNTSLMEISAKTAEILTYKEKKLQEKQELAKSIINLTTILALLEKQM